MRHLRTFFVCAYLEAYVINLDMLREKYDFQFSLPVNEQNNEISIHKLVQLDESVAKVFFFVVAFDLKSKFYNNLRFCHPTIIIY